MNKSENKISAVIITQNEELNIERCLKSLHWVDEIVVVDSGSTDKTIEICKKYNCKIVHSEWLGFGRTKKLAVNSASNSWIFSIDSDEEVTPELRNQINEILSKPKYYAYRVKRKSFYLGKMINHCGWGSDYPLRLFNREHGNFNDKEVHESVDINWEGIKIESPLLHYTYPTIELHVSKTNRYTDLQAAELYKQGKQFSIISAVLLGLNKFINMYFFKLGILDGKEGFILCSIASFGVYLKYVKLWKLNIK